MSNRLCVACLVTWPEQVSKGCPECGDTMLTTGGIAAEIYLEHRGLDASHVRHIALERENDDASISANDNDPATQAASSGLRRLADKLRSMDVS